jgi:hypothetical protein
MVVYNRRLGTTYRYNFRGQAFQEKMPGTQCILGILLGLLDS